jgi:hypothetical protein
LCLIVHGGSVRLVDILDEVLSRVRLSGTLLYHYEMTTPWSIAVPPMPDAVFHYLSRGRAMITLDGQELRIKEGDFVLVSRGESHVVGSDRGSRPLPLDAVSGRFPAHIGIVRHGGGGEPRTTMICGYFHLARPPRSGVLELLPRVLRLEQAVNAEWFETILRRMVIESARDRPGQQAVLSRMTEMLFVEVLRSWLDALRPGREAGSGRYATRTSERRFSFSTRRSRNHGHSAIWVDGWGSADLRSLPGSPNSWVSRCFAI